MSSRRVMIGCGALLLMGLMLACAFSLGIYLGERGLTRGGLQLTPGARPPQVKSPTTPLAAPGGPPNAIGTIQRYGDNSLTVTTPQGPRTIGLNGRTVVRFGSGVAQMADLRPGVAVAVWGDPSDNGRVLVAQVIVILAQR